LFYISAVRFKPPSIFKAISVREANANLVGKLISIRGMVTRVSDIKPCLVVATYICSSCNSEVFQVIQSENFTPLSQCPSKQCTDNHVKGDLTLQTRGSRFVAFQEAKIQELVIFLF
jgi:DNA replication licensing factor MCM7